MGDADTSASIRSPERTGEQMTGMGQLTRPQGAALCGRGCWSAVRIRSSASKASLSALRRGVAERRGALEAQLRILLPRRAASRDLRLRRRELADEIGELC